MKKGGFKFNVGDTVTVLGIGGKTFVGVISGISISPNKVEYSIKDRFGKYSESMLHKIGD